MKTLTVLLLSVVTLFAQTKDTAPRGLTSVTFANLGTPANGTILYCSDCTSANPAASGGSGAVARRENGAWNSGGGGGGGSAVHAFGASFDGGGVVLVSGKTVYYTIPYACTIQAWNINVDTGTATVDIWKVATGTSNPTGANTITASATPAISTGTAIHSTNLTGWTTSVSQNDIVGINLEIVSSATYVNLTVQCE